MRPSTSSDGSINVWLHLQQTKKRIMRVSFRFDWSWKKTALWVLSTLQHCQPQSRRRPMTYSSWPHFGHAILEWAYANQNGIEYKGDRSFGDPHMWSISSIAKSIYNGHSPTSCLFQDRSWYRLSLCANSIQFQQHCAARHVLCDSQQIVPIHTRVIANFVVGAYATRIYHDATVWVGFGVQ